MTIEYLCSIIFFKLLDTNNSEYFLLNSSSIISKGISSIVGLRFSIQNLEFKLELQSLTKNPIQLRYKVRIRTSSIQSDSFSKQLLSKSLVFIIFIYLDRCFVIDTKAYKNINNPASNASCVSTRSFYNEAIWFIYTYMYIF